jgi:hypothetical protein
MEAPAAINIVAIMWWYFSDAMSNAVFFSHYDNNLRIRIKLDELFTYIFFCIDLSTQFNKRKHDIDLVIWCCM